MELVLLTLNLLFPSPVKVTTIHPAAQIKSKSSQLWPSTFILTVTYSPYFHWLLVSVCVCVSGFHVLYLLFMQRNCFVFQYVSSSFPFKAISSGVGPNYQTAFIALSLKTKQTILVLPWPQAAWRSLSLLLPSTSFQVADYSTLSILTHAVPYSHYSS